MTNELSRRALFAGGASALALGALAACSSPSRGTGTASRSGATTVSYWLWDSNQLPAYQAVADAVKIDDLLDLDVVAVEPATSVAKARTDAALRGAGHADITVRLQGSAHDVQELVRRYEEGVR